MSDPSDGIAVPELYVLQLSLPLPPSANRLFRVGPYAGYATAEYRDWLRISAAVLREALGEGWVPDTTSWWLVSGWLKLGKGGDGPNYLKATLDLLSGSRMPEPGEQDPDGKKLPAEKILKRGDGLWNDDRRVLLRNWTVIGIKHPEPQLDLVISETRYRPVDYAAEAKRMAKETRDAGRTDRNRKESTLLSARPAGNV